MASNKTQHVLGYFHKGGVNADGKKVNPRMTTMIESAKKEEEVYINNHLKDLGFTVGKVFKNKNNKVIIPGTYWIEGSDIPEGVANALDGKLTYFENGYIKNATKVNYSSFNPKTGKSSSVLNIGLKEGSTIPFVRMTGNLIAIEKEGKKEGKKEKSYFLSNSILLETKEGGEWKPETVSKHIEELKSLGMSARMVEANGKKYLNITKNIYAAKSSVLHDNDKLFKEIKENKPFVIIETTIYKVMEGGNLLIDKNNNITPLGETSQKVFKNVMDQLTVIPKNEKEDLYADAAVEQEEEDTGPVVY